jgi:hypothetical protein
LNFTGEKSSSNSEKNPAGYFKLKNWKNQVQIDRGKACKIGKMGKLGKVLSIRSQDGKFVLEKKIPSNMLTMGSGYIC